MPLTIADAGERALIARLKKRAGPPPPGIRMGIGDDAAVLEPPRGRVQVLSTDCLVEHVHFRRDWTTARDIGHKAVAASVSDLAAMGARPQALLLSLVLPGSWPLDDFEALVEGVTAEARTCRASLVGGNLATSPGPAVIDITAVGSAHARRILTRGGGRPGDELYVTGSVGGGAAGLALLATGRTRGSFTAREAAAVGRYERPVARVDAGHQAAYSRAVTAATDLSDGLAVAVATLAEASGTGAVVVAGAVPVEPVAVDMARLAGRDPVEWALAGGEDYELLFAVSPRRRRAFAAALARVTGLAVTRIGRLTPDSAIVVQAESGASPLPAGFAHFA
jgi:thiamine-monophosphate kinase